MNRLRRRAEVRRPRQGNTAGTMAVISLGTCVLGMWCAALAARGAESDAQGGTVEASAKANAGKSSKSSPRSASYGLSQVDFINEQIRKGWTDRGLAPSPAASDGEWCRRLYLDVLGRIPTIGELEWFLSNRSANRRVELVDRLLDETGKDFDIGGVKFNYLEEYARNWTTIWTNLLIGRTGGNQDRDMVSREGMQKYLRLGFKRNKRYDTLAAELISATGATDPDSEAFNGAVNFLAGKMEENGIQATAKTAQIFLGMQVQCTQCHTHPFNEWKQSQFWELNAFFRQTRPTRGGNRPGRGVVLTDQDFAGEGDRRDPKNAEIYYELRSGKLAAAYPVFVDGRTEISRSGLLEDVNRRKELARLVVSSDLMPQAAVNRMWGHFFGHGFTKPVDDMGPHNQPSHPELLERLGAEFRKSSYNLKDLIRWIVLSEPYSLSSKFNPRNKSDDPSLGEKPQFSHFYLRQMRAEELYESLLVATQAQNTQVNYEEAERTKGEWLQQFSIAFGTDEGDEATTFNGTIPQVLMMFNGELMRKATSAEQGSFLAQIASHPKLSYSGKVQTLFLAALARKPTASEARFAEQELLVARKGNALAALQDVWWVLLNSNEFILNH